MVQSNSKLWTKDFIFICAANFFLYLVFYLLLVTIAVYAVEQLHASESEAGLVTGIFIVGTLIGRLVIGKLITTIGNRKMLYIGLFIFTITSAFYFINAGIGLLLVTRFFHGMALGMASTATGSIVASIIPDRRKGEGIGYYTMSVSVATAIGPFIGIFMNQHTSFSAIFSFCLLLGLISLVISFFVTVPEVKQVTAKSSTKKRIMLSDFLEPKALPIGVVIVLISIGYSSVLSFINFYAMEMNLVEAASLFFVFYSVAILVSRPFTGRLMDQKGANVVMYPAFVFFGSGLLLLSFSESSIPLLISGVLMGLGFGNMQSTTQAIAVKLASSDRVSLATSTYYIAMDVGLGFGPYFLGLIIPFTGYTGLYAVMGIMVLATIVPYYFLHGKKKNRLCMKPMRGKSGKVSGGF